MVRIAPDRLKKAAPSEAEQMKANGGNATRTAGVHALFHTRCVTPYGVHRMHGSRRSAMRQCRDSAIWRLLFFARLIRLPRSIQLRPAFSTQSGRFGWFKRDTPIKAKRS
jgi:hypothetical protein